jgi:hypothetical protein
MSSINKVATIYAYEIILSFKCDNDPDFEMKKITVFTDEYLKTGEFTSTYKFTDGKNKFENLNRDRLNADTIFSAECFVYAQLKVFGMEQKPEKKVQVESDSESDSDDE